jgi:ubiquinone/menaquinone biosynthesis C-methylase UbiE
LNPLSDVRDVSRLAYGFVASKALFAAPNLDIFSRLEEPTTLEDLAQELGVQVNRLNTLMVTLTALGLTVRDDSGFQNSPVGARYLARGARAYFGDYFRLQIDRQIYPSLEHLDAAMAGDSSYQALYGDAGLTSDAAEAEAFSLAQHAGSLGPAMEFAKTVDLSGTTTLLDIAGGSGAFSITLCKSYPELTATIIDFPNVIEVARRYVTEAALSDRIALIGGDALHTQWPEAQDTVLLSYLLSAVKGRDIPTLFDRSHRSLRPGGRLIVHDFMLDDDEQGSALAAQWFLVCLASEPDATSSAATLIESLIEHRFVNASSQPLIPEITKTVICEKPT